MRRKPHILVLCLVLLTPNASAAVLDLGTTKQPGIDLGPYWSYQEAGEPPALLPTFDSGFLPRDQAHDLARASDRSYWLKAHLRNSSPLSINRLLEIDDPLVGAAELIVVQEHQGVSRQRSGLRVPASEKSIRLPQPVFTIRMAPNSHAVVYLLVQSRNGMNFDAKLWTPEAFFHKQDIYTWTFGIALGVIVVMAVYNLIVALIASEPMFRRLGALLACTAATHLIIQGWGGTYIWGEFPIVSRLLVGPIVALTFIALLSFAAHFLEINRATRCRRWLNLTLAFNAIMAGVLTGRPDGDLFTALMIGNLPVCLLMTFHSAQLARARHPAGLQFLGTLTPLFAAVLFLAANRAFEFGYSSALTQSVVMVASAIVAAGFAIVLADRIRRNNQAHESTYEDLLLAKQHVRESESRVAAANRENQAKSAFLATMSHEIRTPMNGILGMAELLTQTELNPQQHYYLATLKRSGQALMDILNDVLDYSKAEAGRMELEAVDVHLLELLDDTVTLYRDALSQKSLRCYLLLHPDAPEWIVGDPTRLKQVLGNLLSNAIKFTNDGEICVRVSNGGPGQLIFAITDDGIGIAPAALSTLFERFEQADSSISRRYGGTGLGLAISKRLVELMGGRISAQNNADQGATFTFSIEYQASQRPATALKIGTTWLLSSDDSFAAAAKMVAQRWDGDTVHLDSPDDPRLSRLLASDRLLVDEDMPLATNAKIVHMDSPCPTLAELRDALAPPGDVVTPPQPDADKPLANLDVLVAEDNSTNRLVVGKILDNWGANVRFAENGIEATELYQSCHDEIDLVLMDCEMPELDGYAATEAIRTLEADATWPGVPIIALTAHIMPEFRRRAESVGMSDYVTKPLDRDELLTAITTAMEPHQTTGHR